jgi:hypothetical protein
LAQRAGHDFFNGYSTVITAVLFNLFLSEIAHDGQLELLSLVSFVHEQYPQDEHEALEIFRSRAFLIHLNSGFHYHWTNIGMTTCV